MTFWWVVLATIVGSLLSGIAMMLVSGLVVGGVALAGRS
jgi:hypothetical protein